MINLRAVDSPSDSSVGSLHLSRVSDIRFADSIVGNLGAPLGFEEESQREPNDGPDDEDVQVADALDDPLMVHFPSPADNVTNTPPDEEEASS